MVKIELPDGNVLSVDQGISIAELVRTKIGEGLFRASIAATLNTTLVDLTTTITADAKLTIHTWKDPIGKSVFWHSAAHVLAIAVTRLFPDVKLTIGPSIDEGFYYDFQTARPFTDADLQIIEAEMKKVVDEDIPFVKASITYEDAKKLFASNPFKLELIQEYMNEGLTTYSNGSFVDLCRGPHVMSTGKIKAFKLTKYSGAYWRGDAKREQLQRIYGIAFPTKDELKEYVTRIEEAKKRDHRRLMVDLDLVMLHEYAPGVPFFLGKGTVMYNLLVDFIRKEYTIHGYEEVITPQLFNKKLWETSGHWHHYKDNMFLFAIEGQEYSLKPMNCPSHCLIFNRSAHSYKDLPIRIADFGTLHRNELSGALSGLTRVRKFAQDDAHIFCTMEQVEEEVQGVLNFIQYVWNDVFGFKLTYNLSTRPSEKLGDDALWDKAEDMLIQALKNAKINYGIKEGDGAFYGPKIDIDVEDAMGRRWQCPTCQLDFNLPNRFGCQYEGSDGKKHTPVMIHRAVLGSLERFFAMMIEHYAGKFPLWLSPVQVKILPIADRHVDYAKALAKEWKLQQVRVEVDDRPLTTSNKVRQAQVEQVNYILVVGDSEITNNTVNVRTRDNEVKGEVAKTEFVQMLLKEIASKK